MRSIVFCAPLLFACASDDGTTCGEGTHAEDGVCIPDDQTTCGTGTHAEGGTCVPDGNRFELRVVSTEASANGYSKYPVLAFGTNADGTPAVDDVVLTIDRAGAGSLTNPAFALRPLGTTGYFVPCNANTTGCLGPVTLNLALASAPDVTLASVTLQLVQPVGVGTAAPCLIGGNAMFFDGNDYIYNGTLSVTQGQWSANTGSAQHASIHVTPSSMQNGLWWDFAFDSSKLGIPLDKGVYEMAERYPFQSPERPGLSVTGDGRGCNTLTGRFEVHEHVRDASGLARATVTFEQHCEGGAKVLNGCVHYER